MQIGVDFGGTKIEAAALNHYGDFVLRRRLPNPGDYAGSIETVRRLVAEIENETGQKGTIGVGVPGSISRRTQMMRNANSTWLNGKPFPQDLRNALGRDIRVSNDADCLALSEASDGAMAGAKVGFAVILGTGCGGGLVVNGEIIDGANGIGGEWGHIPLPWPTAEEMNCDPCWCGKTGCLETWISGTGVTRDYERATGNMLTAQEIMAVAQAGDAAAKAVMDRFLDRLGRSLAIVGNIVDPDVFVLGGGLSNIMEIYERVPAIVSRYVFSDAWTSKILPAQWGDSSGVRGAAQLWPLGAAGGAALKNVTQASL
jgi:fructokinase